MRLGSADENALYLREFTGWVQAGAWPHDAAARALACPALVVASARDPYCTPDDARWLADRLGGPAAVRITGTPGHFGYFRDVALFAEIADFMTAAPP